MQTYVVLVRGINVGGNKLVKMANLQRFAVDLGFRDAETVLQSGNLLFRCEATASENLERLLSKEAEIRLGLKAEFFVRTAAEWEAGVGANPYPAEAVGDPSHLLVIFLKSPPDEARLQTVRAAVQGPERFQAVGKELFVVYPEGIGNSTLPKTPGWNKLISVGTGRNWNTVLKIAAIAKRLEQEC